MSDPWHKIKNEWPVIFTATTVSILSTTVYHANLSKLASLSFWQNFFNVLVSVGLALAVVYGVVWAAHRTHSRFNR